MYCIVFVLSINARKLWTVTSTYFWDKVSKSFLAYILLSRDNTAGGIDILEFDS